MLKQIGDAHTAPVIKNLKRKYLIKYNTLIYAAVYA